MTSERGANAPESTGAGQDLATLSGRFVAVLIDWIACLVLVTGLNYLDLIGPDPFLQSIVPGLLFAAYYTVALAAGTQSLGMALMRIACVSAAHGGRIGPIRALVRAVLLSLLLPAVTALAHPYHRGLHDLAAGSVMLKTAAPVKQAS
jgi:uncharacterized RDD family membrane protein YckC